LTSLVVASTAGDVITWIVWVVAAVALVSTGVAVVLFSNPFYSALALIGNFASLAVLYLLLSAEFVAAAQVLVYAGAVMVMFLFVIGYLGGRADAPWAGGHRALRLGAIAVGIAILVEVVVALALESNGSLSSAAEITGAFGSPAQIGELFLSDYLLAFEITSIILLVGAVGGVVLGSAARRRQAPPPPPEPGSPPEDAARQREPVGVE
jgi:NADH:ubiquinone oxidoreductase subunit 6 (subunit J)